MQNNQDILMELVKECEVIIEECGLELPPHIIYTMNGRLSRCIGRCKTRDYKKFIIEMSTKHFEANVSLGNMKSIKDTILHEMCHTMYNGFNHGEVWQRYAGKINSKFGYNISRMTKLEDEVYEMINKDIEMVTIVCQDCGTELKFKSTQKIAKHTDQYRCKCGGKLALK